MDYWHLIFQIPAIISAATIVTDVLPFSLDRRYVALLVFLAALVVLNLPLTITVALALVLGVSVANKYLGISFSAKEPVTIPFGKYRTAITDQVRKLRKTPVREYIEHAYEPEPEQSTIVRKFVPDLPGA
jgi:hypothetical protein